MWLCRPFLKLLVVLQQDTQHAAEVGKAVSCNLLLASGIMVV